LTPHARPLRAAGIRLETLSADAVLYHPDLAKVVRLNDTAALVWRLCDGVRTVEEIVATLREAYPEAAPDLAVDVERVLARLVDEGALDLR
jgi:coenzyme PQQ biosynthesis protein PqqD